MSRFRLSFLFALAVLFGAHSALATTFVVGTCRPSLPSYTTISAAVAAVPAGSTVVVCPGTYPEQVTIATPLTLEGVSSANSDQAIVAVPGGGLVANVTDIFSRSYAAQVLVNTGGTGAVNIINITVDGTGNGLGGSAFLAGIFYESGSSGVVNHVTTRNQIDSGSGVGILAENGSSTSESVTIENCSVHDFDFVGIFSENNQPTPTLTAIIKANHVNTTVTTSFLVGIAMASAGSATGNVVTGPGQIGSDQGLEGVTYSAPVFSGNTVTNWGMGATDFNGATYTSNSVSNSGNGFFLVVPGATVKSNTITQNPVGIEFSCNSASVSNNAISDTPVGLNDVRGSFSMANTFFNVGTVRNADGCGFAPAHPGLANGMTPRSVVSPINQ